MMIPHSRILKKNFWCESDGHFVQKITNNFDRWIEVRFVEGDQDLDRSQEQNELQDQIQGQDGHEKEGDCNLLNDTVDLKIIGDNKYGNNCTTITKSSDYISNISIPKIFHFIWLGSELPAVCNDFIDTWRRCHPDWIFNIWLDKGDHYFHDSI